MKTFGNFVKWFLYITTGILVVCGINYAYTGVELVTVDIFGKIFLSAFVTALITVFILPKEGDGKVKSCVKLLLHYIILCAIMSFLGVWFGWINFGLADIVQMAINVGIVYLLMFTVYYIIDIKQADEINKMLQEKYGDEEV